MWGITDRCLVRMWGSTLRVYIIVLNAQFTSFRRATVHPMRSNASFPKPMQQACFPLPVQAQEKHVQYPDTVLVSNYFPMGTSLNPQTQLPHNTDIPIAGL